MNEELVVDPSDLKAGDYNKYYKATMSCHNCGEYVIKYILKGVRRSKVSLSCPNCECSIGNGI